LKYNNAVKKNRMKKISFFLFYFLFGFSLLLPAQIGTFFSTDNDISSSLINSIYQDSRNYIWIATEDGLNKYDGVKFSVYKSNPNDSNAIKNNYVRSLFEDSSGRFWVGCINGLQIYNRATDNFSEIKLYNNGVRVTPHITSIIESKDHEIWIATSEHGVIRINKNDKTYQTDLRISSRLSSMYLTYIFQDSRGIFWIASENQGLNMYDPKNDEVTIFKTPVQIGSNQISAICEDLKGNIFVGTLTNGLYKYNAQSRIFELVPYINHSTLSVKSLLVDDKGRLLIGTDGQGIKIYNEKQQYLEDFQILSTTFDFSKMKVHAICQDKVGNIWTGLFQKGVFVDPEVSNKFEYWGYKSFNHNIIGSGCIMSLLKDKENILWIGTDNDGIYKLEKGVAKHFAPSATTNSVPHTVLSMLEDNLGNLWLGSYLSGLSCLNKETGRCTYFNNYMEILDENSARDKIFCLAKDKHDKLWIGTNGAGVYVFDLIEKKYVNHYSQSQKNENQIPNNWINSIICDKEGVVWIGSYNGICSINTETGRVTAFPNSILPGDIVFSIKEDSKGNIWIGTTEGLACFNKKNQQSKMYTVADGLSSNIVCGILEDENENFWLSTHSGISKLVTNENRFINYYEFDGLQGNEFSMGAAFKSQDGEMFFGGTGGISAFYPSEINDRSTPLNLYLTNLYISGKPVVAGQKSGRHTIFNKFISDVDTIHLSYKDNMFALEFSTFDFGSSPRVYYRYKLEGLNSQWMSTEQGMNRISFTNINYGAYKLRTKAYIYNYSSEEKIITFIISPPWYLTWWARLIYAVLFLLLIWGVASFILDKIRQKSERMRREHAEQISEAKLQFFINISHEIRTPMTLILSPLEKLIKENKEDEKGKVYWLMYRNAQRILRLINQLLDVRKIDKGLMVVKFYETDMVGFIEDLMQTFEYQANERNIKFSFIHTDPQLNVWVDQNNFDKVLVNILSNAFKFTPNNGEISITLRKDTDKNTEGPLQHFFEIIAADTGCGIEESKIEKIFERFYQSNNENSNIGTGIGLHLARSLVVLQHGTLHARNRSDTQGSEFIIRLPLENSHLSDAELETQNKSQPVQPVKDKLLIEQDNRYSETDEKNIKPKTKYRILIVDDEDEIRQYLYNELCDTYKISEAINGKKALEIILKEKPDLVVSDVMMPEIDGITLCKKLKSNVNINHIPIILLTAKVTDEDKSEGFDIGADAYVSKPFNVDLLKKIIAGIIENRERLKQKASDSEENKSLIQPIVLRSSDQILYEKIIKIINENISNPDLNVEMLASKVGMSRVHMHRKLKELTGQSARDFIKSIRLKQAADLLSGKKLSVSEVMYALGFSNLSHFSNSFHEFYGMSPKEYAEQNSTPTLTPLH